MDLTAIFSNDQLAVLGCFGALVACGLIAAVSFRFGPAGREQRSAEVQLRSRIVPIPARADASSDRKAA